MIQRIIKRLLRTRHFWRTVSFDELAELYTSRLLMTFAVHVVSLFAAVYLYQLGYSMVEIALFYAAMYLLRIPFSYVAARVVAYAGPKHAMFYAGLLRIPSLLAFALAPEYGAGMIVVFGLFQHSAATLYDIAYNVDFSKIKSAQRAGREIGTMQIIEKAGKVASPLIGGAIAAFWGPQAAIIVAAVVFAVAAAPLFHTLEPITTRVPLKLRGYPWRRTSRSLVAQSVVGYDFVTSGMLWSLFIAVVIFAGSGQAVYAIIGGFVSLGVMASSAAAWAFGQMIDRHKGHRLLAAGTVAKIAVHIVRPFTSSPVVLAGVNVASETATSAYAMPFMRDVLDMADRSGFRIAYLMFVEMAINAGALLCCLAFAALVWVYGDNTGLMWAFGFAALYQLLMPIAHRQSQR